MKIKPYLVALGFTGLVSCASPKYVLTGSYTSAEHPDGIHLLSLKKGKFSDVKQFKTNNPSYFTFDKGQNFLYSVNENGGTEDSLTVFRFNHDDRTLTKIQQVAAGGVAPCHITTDRSGNFLAVSNYTSGTLSVYRIESSGNLSQVAVHQFAGPAHAHMAHFSKDNRSLYVADLGNDRLYRFSFNATAENPLEGKAQTIELPKGFGPRHFAFDKNENFLYVLGELQAQIVVFKKDGLNFTKIQQISSTNFPNNAENKGSAEIEISPNGKYLYTSNRGESNSLSKFKIEKNGSLTKLDEEKTGLHPRYFTLIDNGKRAIVVSRDSDDLRIYKLSKKIKEENSAKLPKPVFVLPLTQ